MSADTITIAEQLRIAEAAGVRPHEMRIDPEHGLLVSPSGVRKLAAIAADKYAAARVNQQVVRWLRNRMREVKL